MPMSGETESACLISSCRGQAVRRVLSATRECRVSNKREEKHSSAKTEKARGLSTTRLEFVGERYRLVAVVLGLEGAVRRDAEILSLILRELRQHHTDLLEVQAGDFFVELL